MNIHCPHLILSQCIVLPLWFQLRNARIAWTLRIRATNSSTVMSGIHPSLGDVAFDVVPIFGSGGTVSAFKVRQRIMYFKIGRVTIVPAPYDIGFSLEHYYQTIVNTDAIFWYIDITQVHLVVSCYLVCLMLYTLRPRITRLLLYGDEHFYHNARQCCGIVKVYNTKHTNPTCLRMWSGWPLLG